jgi:hypothetical protein
MEAIASPVPLTDDLPRDVELEFRHLLGPGTQRNRHRVGAPARGGRAPGWRAGIAIAAR